MTPIGHISKPQKGDPERAHDPFVIDTRSEWIVFSDYELFEDDQRHVYIRPSKGAVRKSPYNIFKYYPDLLKDFLDLGAILAKNNANNWAAGELSLPFIKRYGLLGCFWRYIQATVPDSKHRMKIVPIQSKAVIAGAPNKALLTYLEYARPFFPLSDPPDYYASFRNQRMEGSLSQEKILVSTYGERVDCIQHEATFLFLHAERSKQSTEKPPVGDLIAGPFYLSVGRDKYDRPQHEWWHSSLIDAIHLMFIRNCTNDLVRPCAYTKRGIHHFIAATSNQVFCEIEQHKWAVHKSRQRLPHKKTKQAAKSKAKRKTVGR